MSPCRPAAAEFTPKRWMRLHLQASSKLNALFANEKGRALGRVLDKIDLSILHRIIRPERLCNARRSVPDDIRAETGSIYYRFRQMTEDVGVTAF